MRTHKIIAWLLVGLLLFCGCSKEETAPSGTVKMDVLFERTEASVEEGHFFFAGKVTSAMAEKRMITFYDAESEKNTFYKVEVTQDPFNCLPDRPLTVCVMGNSESFGNRTALEKGKEYLFDTTLWVLEEEAVMLLPTFYDVLPECQGDVLFYTDQGATAVVNGSVEDYWSRIRKLAEEKGYSAESVQNGMVSRLQNATERNRAYFEKLEFEAIDGVALGKTLTTAKALLAKAEKAQPTWSGIEEILK